jgi:DinB superfamily
LGEWSVVRHVFHLLAYEEHIALPSMRLWLGEPFPSIDHLDEDTLWQENTLDLQGLLEKFRAVRAAQIELLTNLPDTAWQETRDALWGSVTLRWVVTKTFQHTAEHIHDVLSLALFWDNAVRRRQKEES